jgi:hypothetical protein
VCERSKKVEEEGERESALKGFRCEGNRCERIP